MHRTNSFFPTAVHNAMTYQPITDALQWIDQEMGHRYLVLKGREFGTTTRLISQSGPVFVSLVESHKLRRGSLTQTTSSDSCLFRLPSILRCRLVRWKCCHWQYNSPIQTRWPFGEEHDQVTAFCRPNLTDICFPAQLLDSHVPNGF